jgi:hypothetical protein
MTGTTLHFAIKTLIVSGLSSSIKRQKLVDWIKKPKPNFLLPTRNTSMTKKNRK